MANITVHFHEITGRIKPMHAVGQPPFIGTDYSLISYLKEANIPFSRLHDVGGPYGGFRYVDIPNIFRDFDADETAEESYDFVFTDLLIAALVKNSCEPIFRLGVTIENACEIKAYRIDPPKDFAKWARICEHIIHHYNKSWANGFRYNITYWEIWNEPDITPDIKTNSMWRGTPQQYYELYDITAKHLKNCFGDTIKVGGCVSSGLYRILSDPEKYGIPPIEKKSNFREAREVHMLHFFHGFMDYIRSHGTPLDVFTYHSYATAEESVVISGYIRRTLNEYGYENAEMQLNEWNNAAAIQHRGTAYASAKAAAMICAMQDTDTDILCYYDARLGPSVYGGMFNPITYKPFCLYYSFKAFGYLYTLGNQTRCELDGEGLYAVSAIGGEGKAVMIVNPTAEDLSVQTNLGKDFHVYLIDEEHSLDKTDSDPAGFILKANQVVLLKNS